MTHGRCWRAAVGAVLALVAVAPGGAAFAGDSRPSGAQPTLAGVATSVLSLVDPSPRTVGSMADGTLRGAPPAIVRDAGTLAVCALAAPAGCAGVVATRVVGDVAPVGLGGLGEAAPAAGDLPQTAGGGEVLDGPGGVADTAPGSQPPSPPGTGRAGGSLASTGTPVAPGLAGLMLLVLGALLRRRTTVPPSGPPAPALSREGGGR